jgi:hypothetical protein
LSDDNRSAGGSGAAGCREFSMGDFTVRGLCDNTQQRRASAQFVASSYSCKYYKTEVN